MRISPWTKVLLLGFWLGGLAGFVRADTVIVVELMDSDQLVGVSREVALASDDSGGLVSRHAKDEEDVVCSRADSFVPCKRVDATIRVGGIEGFFTGDLCDSYCNSQCGLTPEEVQE